jgi:hypothetical protein
MSRTIGSGAAQGHVGGRADGVRLPLMTRMPAGAACVDHARSTAPRRTCTDDSIAG